MKVKDEIVVKCKGGGSIINQTPLFSPDGQTIYIPWRNFIRSYNVKTGERIAELEGCEDNIIGIKLHPTNSTLLVGCSSTGEIAVWQWQTRLLISVHRIKHDIIIKNIVSFHLIPSNKNIDNDCNILLCWQYNDVYQIGLFSLKTLQFSHVDIMLPKKVVSINVGNLENSPFIVGMDDSNVICAKINGTKKVSCKSGDGHWFTCLATHPEEDCIATGLSDGKINIWRGLFSKGAPAKCVYHWHSLPVNTLTFSQTGTVLYSGANECVVVKWQLDSLNKSFLPRLPAPIVHLTTAQGNAYLAVSTKDNVIHITDSQLKIKSVIQHLTWAVTSSAGILVDARTKALVMNGHTGNLQFYSPHTMTLLYNLDVVGQNKLSEERNMKIPNTNVSNIALTRSGDWFACVEDRIDNNVYQEIRLKFFRFDEIKQSFVLNTSVEFPHENGINSIEFQPPCNSTELLCATSGNDNQFKIWNLVDTSDIYRENYSWRLALTCSYKSRPCSSLSFSSDGSLLAVAFGHSLTTWSPDTCDLKCSLVHPNFKSSLTIVRCGNADQCHLIVTGSSERVCVWNLLTLAMIWTVPVRVKNIVADSLSVHMALITENDEVFVFSPNSSAPIYHRKKLINDGSKILASCFVPRIFENSRNAVWQRMSQLYFISSNQELLCLDSSKESEETNLEYVPQIRKTAFGALVAESSKSSVKKQEQAFHMEKGLSGALTTKEFLTPPVHTMAPMRLLCADVLRSLVLREGDVKEETPNKDDEIPDSSEEKVEDSDSEEFKFNQNITDDRKPKKHKRKEQDLSKLHKESYKWTDILLD